MLLEPRAVLTALLLAPALAAQDAAERVSDEPAAQSELRPGMTIRVSVDSDGSEGNVSSWNPVLSADGTCVAFTASKRQFRPGERVVGSALFVRDLSTGRTERWEYDLDSKPMSLGITSPALSADGSIIATLTVPDMVDRHPPLTDIILIDRRDGSVSRVDPAQHGIAAPLIWKPLAMAADASVLVFQTSADFSQGITRAGSYLYDRRADKVSPLSDDAMTMWSQHPSMSADGLLVVFTHMDMQDADPRPSGLYLLDRNEGTVVRLASEPGGVPSILTTGQILSADGRLVAYVSRDDPKLSDDTNEMSDIFVLESETLVVRRVSVTADGGEPDGSSYFDFTVAHVLSADGRFVVFTSKATNLVDGDTNEVSDVFVRDLERGRTLRVSVASDGTQGDGESRQGTISADGSRVAFSSEATNLVEGDTNGKADIFVRELEWDD